MKSSFAFALVLSLGSLTLASSASAQVIIQGEVSVQQQGYGYQPQPVRPVQPVVYGGQSSYVQTGAPAPQRYIHHSDPIGGLVAGGAIGLAGGFLFSIISEAVLAGGGGYSGGGCRGYGCPDDLWYALTWIPVIGPWLGLGIGNGRDYEWVNYVGGILEDAGLLLLILGLVIHDEWDEPIYAFGSSPDAPALFLTGNGAQLTF